MISQQKIQWFFILLFISFIFYILSPILSPFLFAALLAYLGDPLVDKLETKMSRTLAVSLVFVTIITILTLVVMLFIPLISVQIENLIKKVPAIGDFLQNKILPYLETKLGVESSDSQAATITNLIKTNLNNLPSIANNLMKWLTSSTGRVLAIVANVFLVPVVAFYLLRDWDILVEKIHSLIPRKHEPKIAEIAKESNEMLSAFLRGQFMVMNILGIIYAIGLSIVGLDYAILIGFIAGWLSFVPYLGMVLGLGVSAILAYFQFGDFTHIIGVLVTFAVGQGLEGTVLTPKFVGEKIGLHPVAVIFAVLAGGQIFGFAGVLLALPAAAIINVIIGHTHKAYRKSNLYKDDTKKKQSKKSKQKESKKEKKNNTAKDEAKKETVKTDTLDETKEENSKNNLNKQIKKEG